MTEPLKSKLRASSTSNTNVPRRHNDKLAGRQAISLLQRLIQMFDLRLQPGPGKPEKQDAGMGNAPVQDQLAEFAVRNNKNLSLSEVRCGSCVTSAV